MIGDDDPVGSKAHGIAGVFVIEDALDHQFAFPEVADPFAFPPANRRIEILRHSADVIGETLPVAQIGRDVAEIEWSAETPTSRAQCGFKIAWPNRRSDAAGPDMPDCRSR
jgi:hypothetical protein